MSSIDVDFLNGTLQRVAETALDTIDAGQQRTVEPLGRGNRKETAVVRYDDRSPVVLQLCDEQTWLQTESRLLRAIQAETDVPVPPVLAADMAEGVAFMVTRYVPGDDLHERFVTLDDETQHHFCRAFGAYLGSLHETFRFDEYGSLVVDGDGLRAWQPDWERWFRDYGTNAVETLPDAFDAIREDLKRVIADHSPAQPPPSRLFPWDFRPGNAITADGEVTAVLDWEAPMAAPPALSAAKAEYLVADWYVENPEPLRTAFVEGYEQHRPYPDVKPAHRVAAIADSAVDSTGTVTNPSYPELDHEGAVAFHRDALTGAL
jgi:aminoglycoside phosphotransferase (APT) family kinase protein